MFKQFILLSFIFFGVLICRSQPNLTELKIVENWRFESQELSEIELLMTDEGLLVCGLNGKLILPDYETGKILWINETGNEISAQPVITGGSILVSSILTDKTELLSEISLKTGLIIRTNSSPAFNPKVRYDNKASDNVRTFTSQYQITKNYITKTDKNREIWKAKTGGDINDFQITKYGVLVSSNDNFLYLLNAKNGNKIWKLRLDGRVSGTDIFNDKIGFVGVYGDNKLHTFNLQTGKQENIFSFQVNEYSVNRPLIKHNRLYIKTNFGIVCLSLN